MCPRRAQLSCRHWLTASKYPDPAEHCGREAVPAQSHRDGSICSKQVLFLQCRGRLVSFRPGSGHVASTVAVQSALLLCVSICVIRRTSRLKDNSPTGMVCGAQPGTYASSTFRDCMLAVVPVCSSPFALSNTAIWCRRHLHQ